MFITAADAQQSPDAQPGTTQLPMIFSTAPQSAGVSVQATPKFELPATLPAIPSGVAIIPPADPQGQRPQGQPAARHPAAHSALRSSADNHPAASGRRGHASRAADHSPRQAAQPTQLPSPLPSAQSSQPSSPAQPPRAGAATSIGAALSTVGGCTRTAATSPVSTAGGVLKDCACAAATGGSPRPSGQHCPPYNHHR